MTASLPDIEIVLDRLIPLGCEIERENGAINVYAPGGDWYIVPEAEIYAFVVAADVTRWQQTPDGIVAA